MPAREELIALAHVVRQVRQARSKTPDELAATAGIDREQLDALEAGSFSPTATFLYALAGALGVTPGELMLAAEAAHKASGQQS
jgi:transcriptional regulator with XRE-family HTH domain